MFYLLIYVYSNVKSNLQDVLADWRKILDGDHT